MPKSGRWLLPLLSSHQTMTRALLVSLPLLLTACTTRDKGMECTGEIQTLSGEPRGAVKGMIVDRFSSFSVSLPDFTLESGPLHSSDHQLYIPSATTADGWLAQRISDHRFAVINAPTDQAITFTCP